MADKVCCPGPVCGGNNNNAAGGFREAVCVHTKKVYDSCRSKECLRDIRVMRGGLPRGKHRLDVEAAIRVIYAPKGFGTRAYREFEIV